MFTEGDVREIVRSAVQETLTTCRGQLYGREYDVDDIVSRVMYPIAEEKHEPHAHECEGRLCTVCAEWRARHNLLRHGGNAD